MILEKAYAKINLTLSVLGKRDDGFHELESIMVPVCDLYDEITFEENSSDDIIIIGEEIKENSILKAALAFQNKYHTKGAVIRYVKRIPKEAGLAGGSADSSATLRGLNRLFGLNIPLRELEELASTLGSDNVFCLYNKAAICRGRGEKLSFIDEEFAFDITLIKPEFGLSTKAVFSRLDLLTCGQSNNELIIKAIIEKDYLTLTKNIHNDLLQPAISIEPRLKELIEKVELSGHKCFMSGSGSTLFVIGKLEKIDCECGFFEKHIVKNIVND